MKPKTKKVIVEVLKVLISALAGAFGISQI